MVASADDEPSGSDEGSGWLAPLDPLFRFHNEHPVYFWLAIVATAGLALAVGAIVAPELVIDRFLWTHFWGPTQADANQAGVATRNGIQVTEDYTLTSEIVYGGILAGALISIYTHLFKKRGIAVDGAFIGALLPYIFFGPLARTLEDASVFCEVGTESLGRCDPGLFSWLFISPFIYLVAAAAVVAHLLMAYRTRGSDRSTRLQLVGAWLGVQAAAYAAVFYAASDQFVVMLHPLTVLALAAVSFGVYALVTARGGRHQTWALASWGLPMVLAPTVLIYEWEIGREWVTHAREGVPEIIWVTLVLTLLVTALVALVGWLGRKRHRAFTYFLAPLNLGLVAGHMVDGFATFSAICSSATSQLCSGASFLGLETTGYGEKHPVSEIFLGFADGWGFPVVKLLLVVVIVVLIDRSLYEGDEDPTLVGIVKLAILVLGLAPGVRDVARVAMGV